MENFFFCHGRSPLATSRWSLNPARHGGAISAAMIWPLGRLECPQGPDETEPDDADHESHIPSGQNKRRF
jgi:hypothetical protein